MELLNWADGPVMTMFAGMSEDVNDEDIKQGMMCCFLNAPTTIQAIQVLRSMQQIHREQARLYTACYEVLHYRANQLMADEQTQNLHGSDGWVPPPFLTRTQVCFNSYLYAH